MARYSSFSDDFYINLNLNTELELGGNREAVLHYFEQIRRHCPSMRNFYCRERSELFLEEDKEAGHYRWAGVEPRRLSAGHVNPETIEQALELHEKVLQLAPYTLSISSLDCESLNVMFGFDFTYRGNHNQLVAEVLGVPPAYERLAEMAGTNVLAYEPALQLALDDDCRVQLRLSIETRTSAYHVRTGDYPEEQLSVYVTARRYGSLESNDSFVDCLHQLAQLARDTVDDYVVEQVLRPLQQAIAMS